MRKTLTIFCLAAGCLVAAPQTAIDAPGVTVSLGGAPILHRTAVLYPASAVTSGAQGTVTLEVKLDAAGEVSDAQVLSGPDSLRKVAIESVLQWHFAKEVAGTTRSIQITFDPPKSAPAASPAALPVIKVPAGTVRNIRTAGLSEQATASLLASLPVHEGDEWNADLAQRVKQAATAFDEHLSVGTAALAQAPGGATQLDVVISSPMQRIKVGGAVIAASILRKTPPAYPAEAKAAGIQGVVHLAAIIGSDGAIQSLSALSGPPELIQASLDAVKQWVYKPTLLNGGPVSVETTIDINFTLSQ
jgi:protein TonB